MKLSETTMEILKNCSKLNQSIVIEKGNVIRSVNTFKTTMFRCEVPETFNNEVRLFSLPDFIRVLTLFTDPDFDFREESVVIRDDSGAAMEYTYADRADLMVENRDPPPMDVISEFNVTHDQMNKLTRAAGMHKVEDIAIMCTDGAIQMKAHNKKRITTEFTVDVAGTSSEDFRIYLKHGRKCAKIELLPLDYTVQVGKLNGRIAIKYVFNNESFAISYLVAAEFDSFIGIDDHIPF